MPIDDFISGLAELGGSGKGWRSWTAILGIVVGLTRGWPLTKAVRLGSAAGAAKLLTPGTAPCTRDDTERLFEQTVNPIDIDLVNS